MALAGFNPLPSPVAPLDQMSWNDRLWTPEQADILTSQGFDMTGMKVMPRRAFLNKAVLSESSNAGQARWPGDTGRRYKLYINYIYIYI